MKISLALSWLFVLLACGLTTPLHAETREDKATAELAKPDGDYKKVLVEASTKYLKTIEEQIKATKPGRKLNGEQVLKRIKRLEEAREKFEADHSLIWVSTLQKPAEEYESAVTRARNAMDAAYQKVIDKLVKEKETELAETFVSRRKEFVEQHNQTHPPRAVAVWKFGLIGKEPHVIALHSNGRVNVKDGRDSGGWKIEGNKLIFTWPNPQAPGGVWIDTCTFSPDRRSVKGRNQVGANVGGILVVEDF